MTDAQRIHEAFKSGDLETLRSAAGDLPEFPNCRIPPMSTHCLEYAIYHSPFSFIQTLVDLGADPNYKEHGGFPSIIAALSTDREDKYRIVEFLISSGADVNQRGVNDYTPLHYAAARNDPSAIELLVSNGADLAAQTRIDDFTTPLEEAQNLNCFDAVKILKGLSI
jgi:uncharacterized protein